MFTAGKMQLGGNANSAYSIIALVVGILSPLFLVFTLSGARENRDDMEKPADKVSFKLIADTIFGNDQLRWMVLIYLLHQIANNLIIGGIGANYVYFRYGYEGGLYSLFSTVGMAATALLMVFYPAISRKLSRKAFLRVLVYVAAVGCILMLVSGLVLPANMAAFWMLTIGYMLLAFGLYGFHLVLMISIFNTVEYNELKKGSRREGIITSIRPFITKLGCALVVVITSLCYLLFRVTDFTNKIAGFEQAANQNLIDVATKNAQIAEVIQNVGKGQSVGMLLFMVFVPLVLLLISYLLYIRFYKLDEEQYAQILSELENRSKAD